MPTQTGPQPPKEDRDPNKINQHVKVDFYNVHGEPNGTHSFDLVWDFSEIVYKCWLDLCYGIFSCCCGVWLVMYWGCTFAYTAFAHIWILSPCLFIVKYVMDIFARPIRPIIECCIKPCTAACGHIFIVFVEPGTDTSKWGYPDIKTPVRKVKIAQSSPVPVKRKVKEETQKKAEDDIWLGEKERMARSVKRQMML